MAARPDDDALTSTSTDDDQAPPTRPDKRPPGLRSVAVALALSVIGALATLAGVGVAVSEDDRQWDRWGAIAGAVALVLVAVLLVTAIRAIRNASRTPRHSVEGIQAAIEIEPEVLRMVHLRAHHLGPEDLLVAAKVELLHDLTLADAAAVVNRIETNIRLNVAEVSAIYLETDVDESHRDSSSFVRDTVGHIDRHDPDYRRLTGQVAVIDPSNPPAEAMTAEELDDDIWS